MGQFKQTVTEMEEIVEQNMTGFNDEIQKQFASLLTDCYYRFGIDQSDKPERNEEVFDSALEAIDYLTVKTDELEKKTTILFASLLFVTTSLIIMIVTVAYLTTI